MRDNHWKLGILAVSCVALGACKDDPPFVSNDASARDGGRLDVGVPDGSTATDLGVFSDAHPGADVAGDAGESRDMGTPRVCSDQSIGGLLNDPAERPPPATGPYAYNVFAPEAVEGASFVDPVFGSTVKRVSNDGDADDLYARNMWWNADGSRYLHRTRNGTEFADFWDVIDVATGVVTHENIPIGGLATDSGFDPVDPEVLYRVSPSGIEKITLQPDGTWTTDDFFTPPDSTSIGSLGGTVNWIDARGSSMIVRHGPEPSIHLYDMQNLDAGPYEGAVDASSTVGAGSYVGITPSGRHLAGYGNAVDWPVNSTGTEYGLGAGVSWSIDHENRRIGPPTYFWNLCGDHGTFVSASDGRDYMVVSGCTGTPGLYRVDITWDAVGKSEEEQLAHNMLLVDIDWGLGAHMAAVARGPLQDWGFVSTEDGDDDFDAGVDDGTGFITPWKTYGQEIIAFNVLTGDVRRLAHHRSREMGDYRNMPRVSASWGGEWVGWQSNFNQRERIDTYAIRFCVDP